MSAYLFKGIPGMMRGFSRGILIIFGALILFQPSVLAGKDSALVRFEPFLNKVYKGYFIKDGKQGDMFDVFYWEKILNGNAIRAMHSVNDGIYGGETIFRFDRESGVIQFYYFTTAHFMTKGTVSFEGDVMLTDEIVEGNDEGITRVRAETRLLPDGRVHVKSQMLKKGEWIFGHEIYYTETPGTSVKFKD